jgi:hypothetical protein
MVTLQTEQHTDAWRILLFASNGSELLVLRRPSDFCLPVLCVPGEERIAASLNREALRVWNVETVCVAPLEISHTGPVYGHPRYHVMEVRKPEELSRIAPKAMNGASLTESAFADVRDYFAVRQAMKLGSASSTQNSQSPFSRFEAFQEISTWVEQQLSPLRRQWDGAFRQLHASDSFALIRFQTDGGGVWFKATGEPNRRELRITQILSDLFPRHTARLIAVRSEWNAWLCDEIEGVGLDSTRDLASWCHAAKSLAELQVASIGHTSPILACGGHDSRIAMLLAKIPPFFAAIESLMEAQVKTTPRPLNAQEIRVTQLRLAEALRELEAAPVPDTLNHFDLNPGNAIVCRGGCRFLDWAEAAIGNPFLSFEYLRQHFVRAFGDNADVAMEFRKSYVNVWRELLPQSTIERAVELSPLIAPFAFAATLPRNDAHSDAKVEFAGFLRSLARRMHREAEQLTLRAA